MISDANNQAITTENNNQPPMQYETYKVWKHFSRHWLGMAALGVVLIFSFAGIYAPFLASSKPLVVDYAGTWYFPLFRYLFYSGFYSKLIDIFFNLLMFTLPLGFAAWVFFRKRPSAALTAVLGTILAHLAIFGYLVLRTPQDPAASVALAKERQQALQQLRKEGLRADWDFELRFMTPYAKLNLLLDNRRQRIHHEQLQQYEKGYDRPLPTLWQMDQTQQELLIDRQKEIIRKTEEGGGSVQSVKEAKSTLDYFTQKRNWLDEQEKLIRFEVMPLIRSFHWEEDAGGEQSLNQHIPWWEVTRINRKDLVSALIFGVRISLVVGILSVGIALIIGIPIGAYAGFYAGKVDIIVSRLLEIWEAMPTFFMLLLVVAITQSKSIFLVIAVVGLFGWTGFSRYIRGEFFKQRNLAYVEAGRSLGFSDTRIIFSHILPNAIPPVLTLLPFAIMGAITSEAGLSFLGLGEEGSSSWGVLMDEGRSAFPGESYLLWPPAILLTTFLVAIALVGDALRDAIDPKMHH